MAANATRAQTFLRGDASRVALVLSVSLGTSAAIACLAAVEAAIPPSWLGLYFDGEIYLEIAKSFPYPYAGASRPYLSHAPGYPALIALLRVLTPAALLNWGWLALLASWIPAAGSAAVFHALCRETGLRPLAPAMVFALLNPTWLLVSASAHAESLAMLFALLSLLAHLRERFGWAIVWLSLAGLTRYPALLLGLPMAIDLLVVRRHAPLRSLALLTVPLASFTAWNLYLKANVSGFSGLFGVRNVPFVESLTWPFSALAVGAWQWGFSVYNVIVFATLAFFLTSVVGGFRTPERRLLILPIWVATLVLLHVSLSPSKLAHAFPRLALLAWPVSTLILWRSALKRVRIEVLLAICAGVAVFGILWAEQRIVRAIHLVNRFPWFESRREALVEIDEPRWYRVGIGSPEARRPAP